MQRQEQLKEDEHDQVLVLHYQALYLAAAALWHVAFSADSRHAIVDTVGIERLIPAITQHGMVQDCA